MHALTVNETKVTSKNTLIGNYFALKSDNK